MSLQILILGLVAIDLRQSYLLKCLTTNQGLLDQPWGSLNTVLLMSCRIKTGAVLWRWPAKRAEPFVFALIFFTQPPIPVAYFVSRQKSK